MVDKGDIRLKYDSLMRKKIIFIPILTLILFIVMIMFTGLGSVDIKLSQVLSSIINGIKGDINSSPDSRGEKVIFYLRLPRILLAVLAGMGLSMSGAVMQGITKNPMVSPFTIGVSSAAALGASIAIVFNLSFFPGTNLGIVINAFISAFICSLVVYKIARKLEMTPEAIVLSGISINYLFSALTSTIQFMADENKLSAAIMWTFGSLNGANWNHVIMVFVILLVALIVFMLNAWKINALVSGGDEVAISLGIDPIKVRIDTGIFSIILTAAIVSFTGVIGFIGLIGPHIARLIVGGDNRFLIPYAGLIGGFLLLISDTIGRTILSPVIIPVGIVISYLGVPLFIHLILKNRRRGRG